MPTDGMEDSPHRSRWLLIVDDDKDSAETLSLLLTILIPGLVVVPVFDGSKASDLAKADHPPFAVVLDMEMPIVDGWATAARIRAEATGDVPLLIGVSGNLVRLNGAFERKLIDHALPKPIDTAALVQLLHAA